MDNSLYKTKEWYAIRGRRLRVEPLCRMCAKVGVKTKAGIVDHIIRHRQDPKLFYDYHNTQSLCKFHHDSIKKSDEFHGYSRMIGEDGWPTDPAHPVNEGKSSGRR